MCDSPRPICAQPPFFSVANSVQLWGFASSRSHRLLDAWLQYYAGLGVLSTRVTVALDLRAPSVDLHASLAVLERRGVRHERVSTYSSELKAQLVTTHLREACCATATQPPPPLRAR